MIRSRLLSTATHIAAMLSPLALALAPCRLLFCQPNAMAGIPDPPFFCARIVGNVTKTTGGTLRLVMAASEAQTAAAVLGYNFPGSEWYQDSYFLMTGEGTRPPDEQGGWFSGIF